MPLNPTSPVCGAKTRSGGKCQNPPMPNKRCRMHGGKNLNPGPGHPAYKHGHRSTWLSALPRQLAESAQESIEQGAEIAQDNSIATIDALLAETASQMDRGASDGLWKALGQHARRVRKLKTEADSLRDLLVGGNLTGKEAKEAREKVADYEIALESVFTLIDEGAAYAGHRGEVVKLLEQRRKHADTEIKRRTAAYASMQSSQVLQMFASMLELALGLIPDKAGKSKMIVEMKTRLPLLDSL